MRLPQSWIGKTSRGLVRRRSLHAHVLVVVERVELGAVEGERPRKAELLEDWFASLAHLLADGPTRPDDLDDLLGAHRCVDGAEEEPELRRTPVLDQRREGSQLEFSVLLGFVSEEVRQTGHVVAKSLAGFEADRLALPHLHVVLRRG